MFLKTWNFLTENLAEGTYTTQGLRDMFYKKIKQSKDLEYELNVYKHSVEGSLVKTFDYLMAMFLRCMQREEK